jgi:catechol 2,3-dioxygenase-like lactoylglutathione lyase family enzyme
VLFRLNVEVGDLDGAATFYGELLGQTGRKLSGSRADFTCGGVTLHGPRRVGERRPAPGREGARLDVARPGLLVRAARGFACLSAEDVHGAAGGTPNLRPWGERSFQAHDPWGNPLCFVEEGTVYAG